MKANQMLRRNNKATPCLVLIDENGGEVIESTAKANLLARHYEAISSDTNLPQTFLTYRREFESKMEENERNNVNDYGADDALNSPFSVYELRETVKNAKDSAAGRDRVTVSMLRHLSESALKTLLALYNESGRQGRLPRAWKHSHCPTSQAKQNSNKT